ncbi:hypothetical protein TNCV_779731 [Trichonephila clavipes]|nr:hypothetical protein TNCV_779731 [Trichonephila clavipes]
MEVVTYRSRKMCWYTIVQEPQVLVRSVWYSLQQLWEDVLLGKKVFCSIEAFGQFMFFMCGHSPRLDHCPSDNCDDFHRLNLVCDPMFFADLPSPCCLL